MSQQKISGEEPVVITSQPCRVGSHVRIPVVPGNKLALKEIGLASYSNNCDYSQTCAQVTQYLKTSLDFAQTGFRKCSEKLPRSGMMRNGILYELPALVHPIGENGCSLLPTPSGTSNGHRNHVVGRLDEWGGSSNPFRGTDLARVRCASFEEWMMGLLTGWTELTVLEMPSSRSKSTRSSKRLQTLKEEI